LLTNAHRQIIKYKLTTQEDIQSQHQTKIIKFINEVPIRYFTNEITNTTKRVKYIGIKDALHLEDEVKLLRFH